ncbi:hypothetical protein M3223_03945 [Paenibacillus pasadenensis]|uniref:hypothetical protein n=1 Tax=Paenibacillus pasadenensis TaxID=217090 RepID=UPI00203FD79B|nr:hypothetical protein [Paenibacillus pasadenensis]MCM3746500.1 hypothetical protein [Paenibacillus pasadenensis]
MAEQFVDLRLSQATNLSSGGPEIYDGQFLLVGDIGLQTVSVANTPLASSVKVMLNGTVTFFQNLDESNSTARVTLVIEKNGGDTFGSGIFVYEELVQPGIVGEDVLFPAVINCADFPTTDEANAGQIRYTLFITSDTPQYSYNVELSGPATFNGVAAAG